MNSALPALLTCSQSLTDPAVLPLTSSWPLRLVLGGSAVWGTALESRMHSLA